MNTLKRVCLLGFGEVGTTLAQNLADVDVQLSTYDVLFADEKSAPSRASERLAHVRACSSVEDAVRGSQLVISAVTADQCHPASKLAARSLEEGAWFLDLNSVSPGTRRQAAVERTRGWHLLGHRTWHVRRRYVHAGHQSSK